MNTTLHQPSIIVSHETDEERFVVVLSKTTLKPIDVVSTLEEFWTDETLRNSTFSHLEIVKQLVSNNAHAYWKSVRRTMESQALRTCDAVALTDKMWDFAKRTLDKPAGEYGK